MSEGCRECERWKKKSQEKGDGKERWVGRTKSELEQRKKQKGEQQNRDRGRATDVFSTWEMCQPWCCVMPQ